VSPMTRFSTSLLALALLVSPALAEELPGDWKQQLEPEDDAWKEVEQVFTFNNGAEPETLDPQLMTGVPEHRLGMALFEGLVTQHPETLAPVPGVAERWEVSADGTVYTFQLRKDAQWSNGRKLDANDFYASWQRALTPATGCQYGYMFYPIKNAQAFHKDTLKDFSQVGIEVVDAHTLKVTLEAPCAYFLDLVSFETLMPVPMWVVEEHGDRWSRAENIVGNGPFVLKEWLPNQRLVMEPSPTYWDKDFVKLERLVALPYDDMETSYKLFQQDQCDWMTAVPAAKIDEIKRHPDYYAAPYVGSYFYRINVTKAPFDDVRVRKALAIGFDREVITRDILKAGQIPATWFCPQMPGYEPVAGPGYDRAAAKRLLAEAGYPDGKGFPEVELLYNTNEAHKQVAEVIVQQWKENLGIKVALRNTEWKVYLSDVEQLNYQVARAGWIGDYTDPNTFLDMFVTGGGNNNTGWSSETYDKLIADAARESDPAKRFKLLQDAERLLTVDEYPIIPIYIYVNQGMLKEKVGGWYENVRDMHPFQYLYIEPIE
jgi:oligopeptide transport system substrate-binding protein